MKSLAVLFAGAALAAASSGCTFHSPAKDFNGLVGHDDRPVNFTSTSKVGLRLLVLIPFLGNMDIDGLVEDMTEDIRDQKGNKVRIVQADSENYWYGFPPLTWIITPVISTVAATYEPDAEVYRQEQEQIRVDKEGGSFNPTDW